MPACSGSGPAQPGTAPRTRLRGHGDRAIPTSRRAVSSEQGATRAADHPLVLASSCQPLPILPPQRRLAGKSSGKQLDSKAHLRKNYNTLFHSNVSLNTNSKQNACAPDLPDYCRARSCSHRGGNPPAKLPPGAPAPCPRRHTMLCWMHSERQERPEQTLHLQREIQLPAKNSLHLL